MAKTLYLENGMANDAAASLVSIPPDRKPLHLLPRLNLLVYDVIVVPSYSNQDLLKASWTRLRQFLRYGGVLVVLAGARDETSWLEFCVFQPKYAPSEEYQFLNQDSQEARAILREIPPSVDNLAFHDRFFAHGSFLVNPSTSIPIISERGDTRRAVLAVLSPAGFSGKLLVTTLDPDYHATAGHTREGTEHNTCAEQLFRNLLEWAVHQSDSRGPHERWARRSLGWSAASLRSTGLVVTTSITLLAFVGWASGFVSPQALGVLGSMASLVGLVFAVHQWREARR